MPTSTVLALAAVAALALPCTAVAGPAPLAANGIPVGSDRQVSGSFESPGTQDWRVYLRQGRHYAVWGSAGDHADVRVTAAGGKALASFSLSSEASPHGGSFTAPYTGLYGVTVTCDTSQSCNPPNDYTLSAGRDCPGDRSTACGISPGQTLNGLQERFIEDDDWFRTRLQGGHTYQLSIVIAPADTGQTMLLAVLDAGGRVLARQVRAGTADQPLTFRAPASGTYFIEAAPDDSEPVPTYSLSLSR